MYCIKCGKQVPDNSVFCPFCGARQDGATGEAAAPAANNAAETASATGTAQPSAAQPNTEYAQPTAAQPGVAYAQPVNQSPIKKANYNLLCILGFVISLVSLVFNYFGLVGLGGLIVSVIGLVLCNRRRENGRILGVLGTFIGATSVIVAVLAMM